MLNCTILFWRTVKRPPSREICSCSDSLENILFLISSCFREAELLYSLPFFWASWGLGEDDTSAQKRNHNQKKNRRIDNPWLSSLLGIWCVRISRDPHREWVLPTLSAWIRKTSTECFLFYHNLSLLRLSWCFGCVSVRVVRARFLYKTELNFHPR